MATQWVGPQVALDALQFDSAHGLGGTGSLAQLVNNVCHLFRSVLHLRDVDGMLLRAGCPLNAPKLRHLNEDLKVCYFHLRDADENLMLVCSGSAGQFRSLTAKLRTILFSYSQLALKVVLLCSDLRPLSEDREQQ